MGGDGYGGGGIGAAELGIILCVVVFLLLIVGTVCFLLFRALDAVPPEHRKMEPWQVFLLFIPCFGLIWAFFVFTKIPQSYRSFFTSVGDPDPTESLEQLGIAYAILALISCIPYLGGCFGLFAFGVLIFFLIKVTDLRSKLLMHESLVLKKPPTVF